MSASKRSPKTGLKSILSFKVLRWVILLVILIGVGLGFYWNTIPEAEVSRATRETAQDIVLGTVKVEEYHLLELRAEREGMVLESPMEIGDQVTRGQILLKQDTEDKQLELERLLIEKDTLEKNYAITHPEEYTLIKIDEDLEDLRRDVQRGIRPERELELALRNRQLHIENMERREINEQTNLSQKDLEIRKHRLDIEKMTLRSPVDGEIIEVFSREGDLVNGGQTVFHIIDSRRLVTAEISEEDYDKVEVGLPALIKFLAYPEQTFNATVTQLLPTANAITQRYIIYLEVLDIEPERLTPGLTGEVSIIADRRENSVLIPSQALIGNNVLRVKGGQVQFVKVVPGFRSLLKIEILEGIQEGDVVITEDLTSFRDGELVRTSFQ